MTSASITIIGDVHNLWSTLDADFLSAADQDLTLFVGDLGDEDVKMVREIADLPVPKAVMLGNHDAWRSFTNKKVTSALRESIEVLGDEHLAYRCLDVPAAKMTIVGARPFSWGGADIRSPEVYGDLFGVWSMEDSAEAIAAAATKSAGFKDLIVLAHNGPKGLSMAPETIFGKDFGRSPGGDWGDLDLAMGLELLTHAGFRVRAVIAGHMHHRLHRQVGGGLRTRFVQTDETRFFNAAVVPRIRKTRSGESWRHYLGTRWEDGRFESAEEFWVDETGTVRERLRVKFHEVRMQRV